MPSAMNAYHHRVVLLWPSGAMPIALLMSVVLLLRPAPVAAQPREGHFVDGALGYGLSSPYDGSEVRGTGVLAKGEYVYAPSSWAGVRPYGGMVLTWRDQIDVRCVDTGIDCEVTAKIGVLGAKGRLAIPIPWVAPFFELGAGLSFGSLRTRTPEVDRTRSGVLIHVPVSIGLAIGPEHEIEFAFVYYYHPVARQFAGAAALGLSFPLNGT